MRHESSLGLRMLRGVELSVLGQAAVFAVNLAVTPMVVRGLGPDGYALYTLMWTALGYLVLLNGGTGVAVQRFTAQCGGKGGLGRLAPLLRRVLAFNVLAASLGGLVLMSGRGWIMTRVLHVQGAVLDAGPRVMACVAVAAPFYFALQFAVNVIYGLQRFAGFNLLVTLQSIGVALCAAALLKTGRGLREIAAVFVFVHAALAAGALWSVRRALAAAGEEAEEGQGRAFVEYSAKSYLSGVFAIIASQGDRAFIGSLLPLSQMGYYVVSASLTQKFNVLCGAVAATSFPMFSELHGKGENARLRRFYLKSSELSLYFILLLSILSFVCVPQFMDLWLGGDFSARSTWPFRLLVISNFVYLATYLPNTVASGRGAPHLFAYAQAGKVLLLLVLWPLFIRRWGILGAAMGQLAADAAVTPFFVWKVHRRFLGLSWGEFLAAACWRPAAAGAGLVSLALAVHAHLQTWTELLAFNLVGGLVFLAIGYGMLDREGKGMLAQWLGRRFA